MKTINWGIIGCGDVTEVKSGPAFNKVKNSALVAVMRRNAEKAKDYASRHNVPKWYSNADELINDPDINAIYVATPPDSHEEYTIKALRAGKPVYVEKPMSLNEQACRRMIQQAVESNIKMTVAHYRRQMPLFKKVKELIDTKAIGDIKFVDLKFLAPFSTEYLNDPGRMWRVDPAVAGGGLFHDLAPHQVDLMLYYFGNVKAASGVSFNQGRFYNADDIVSGNLLFENGVVFEGLWCFTVSHEEAKDACEITGSEDKLSFTIFGGENIIITKKGKTENIPFKQPPHVQQPMIEKVVEYFLDEGPNPCTGEDGAEVMRLLDVFTQKQA